jgi:hypothetical protein
MTTSEHTKFDVQFHVYFYLFLFNFKLDGLICVSEKKSMLLNIITSLTREYVNVIITV